MSANEGVDNALLHNVLIDVDAVPGGCPLLEVARLLLLGGRISCLALPEEVAGVTGGRKPVALADLWMLGVCTLGPAASFGQSGCKLHPPKGAHGLGAAPVPSALSWWNFASAREWRR